MPTGHFVFKDPTFEFEFIRLLGYAPFDGADIAECVATALRITDGDFESWYREWCDTAQQVKAQGMAASRHGDEVGARNAFLRASNYYRSAEFFLHGNPTDPRVVATWQLSVDAFRLALGFFKTNVELVEIPYENTTLPGYLFYSSDYHKGKNEARPLLIHHGGFDSIQEECYFMSAAGAISRGYHTLIFEGPGQGGVLRKQNIRFRPDWEAVVTPVVDWALKREEIDPLKIALMGTSLGGFLAVRAAAFEYRLAACISIDGFYDFWEVGKAKMPAAFMSLWETGMLSDSMVSSLVAGICKYSPSLRWEIAHTLYSFGVENFADAVTEIKRYNLKDGVAEKVRCPTLITGAEKSIYYTPESQNRPIYDHLTCKQKTYMLFAEEDAGGVHCKMGGLLLCHQKCFEWLDKQLDIKRATRELINN
ncbi:alpha/beta-hydrolase [Basidiobolus meristosporus CBS 931.73]|uniref:Alpha/beta-hydrolase n=1 Tax=Basidiobolus meristosporus CBS 931.73 TaxID=1314790 RepID=A0A1Y1XM98_9FUNG|nr:alpha/beta-hydrolase [Basidiobolus meristosporus CBS 931.73]|eukprot:ORX86868.1 alpha/beta-hydrolase [Basidiobolus meristosporus CBS 931.73]